jgi:hypothetical protein
MSELRRITERYRLDKLVSSTDAGSVHRAIDLQSGETVAVKLINGDDGESQEQRERFLKTAAALQSLRHPGVPRVTDYGFTPDGGAFLVTEYLQGVVFEDLAGSPPGRLLPLLITLVDGLEAMARKGISCRNLRAGNLLVVPAVGGEQIKVLGLGSAILEPGALPVLDGYPEDLHAFGLLACRMLRVPEDSKLGVPLAVAVELEDVEALRALLDAALHGDPEGRYPSYAEVRQALRLALTGRTGAPAAAAGSARPGLAPDPLLSAETVMIQRPGAGWDLPAAPAVAVPASGEELDFLEDLEATIARWEARSPSPPPPPASPASFVTPALSPPWPPPPPEAAIPPEPQWAPPLLDPEAEVGESTIARPPEPAAPRAARPASRRRLLLIGIPLAALSLAAVAVALIVFLRPSPPQPPPPPPEQPKAVLATPAAPPPVATPAPALPPVQPQLAGGMAAAPAPLKREELAAALARALDKGDLRALRALAAAVPLDDQTALPPEVQGDLALARKAVAVDDDLARAQKAGNLPQVVQQADALLAAVPHASRAAEQKERAASALETAADGEIAAGQLDAAAARLEGLRRVWPDRPGLAGRLDRIAAERKADQDSEALLASAARAERANKPLDGLQLLAGARPSRRYADRFQEARGRLEAQIAQIDRQPPVITPPAAEPLYEKGKLAAVALRITDDLSVKSVEGWARAEGGSYAKVTVRHLAGDQYVLEVPPELHQNKTVEYYVTALDPSGHAGQLGSADHPRKLKRKNWIDKILGRKDEKDGGR